MDRLRRCGRGRFGCERGVALVEFALVLPFLLLVVLGMVDLGKAVAYWNDQTHLAGQAARYAAVNTCAPCNAANQTINAYIPSQAESDELRKALLLVPAGTAQAGSGDGVFFKFTDPGAQNHCTGDAVKVTVQTSYSLPFLGHLPFIGGVFGLNSMKISSSATSRLEQNWGDSNGAYRPGVDKYFPTDPAAPSQPDPSNPSHDSCPP
jgi:Flp pilus assembly protein TadG